MNKMLNFQCHGIFCIISGHTKVFMRSFHEKPVSPVIWWSTAKEKPSKFLETVILGGSLRGNFNRKVGSSLYYHANSVHTCSCVCICLILQFAYLTYYCFCAMLFLVSYLSIVNIICCLCYMPGVYLKSPMFCLRCVNCLLFSKTR